jgi:hypothetical protein
LTGGRFVSLLASGIALSVVTRSLHEIRKWLPDARLSNLRRADEGWHRQDLRPRQALFQTELHAYAQRDNGLPASTAGHP